MARVGVIIQIVKGGVFFHEVVEIIMIAYLNDYINFHYLSVVLKALEKYLMSLIYFLKEMCERVLIVVEKRSINISRNFQLQMFF